MRTSEHYDAAAILPAQGQGPVDRPACPSHAVTSVTSSQGQLFKNRATSQSVEVQTHALGRLSVSSFENYSARKQTRNERCDTKGSYVVGFSMQSSFEVPHAHSNP